MSKRHELQQQFLLELRARGIPEPLWGLEEYQFHRYRLWPFDMAWVAERVAVEIQGGLMGTKSAAGHFSQKGFAEDSEKMVAAQALGWIVIPVNYYMIEKGLAGDLVEEVMAAREIGLPQTIRRRPWPQLKRQRKRKERP